MLNRRALAAGLGLLPFAPALAQAAPPLGALPDGPPGTEIGAGRDSLDRLTIPVTIDGQGPFRFVVDTGADRSVIADDIATQLGKAAGPLVLVHGIAGMDHAPSMHLGPIKVGHLSLKSGPVPVLPRAQLGADGMLGVDVLQGRRLIMDFDARILKIRASEESENLIGGQQMVVRAHKRFGRLTVVDALADRVTTAAFVDSGAELSVGNLALAEKLSRRLGPSEQETTLYGVTTQTVAGSVRRISSLQLGGVEFTDLPLVFADLHLFDLWGLKDKPTVLLGMNVLRLFSRVELDYGAKALRFRLSSLTPPGYQVASA